MKIIRCVSHKVIITCLCFFAISLKTFIKAYAQEGSYSVEAKNILDSHSDDLSVFKFSINNILNSDGEIVEKPAGNPSIFGRTDYGSEFFLENELSQLFQSNTCIRNQRFSIRPIRWIFSCDKNGTQKLNIDFKDLYDTESGEVITPEMGFVKLIDDVLFWFGKSFNGEIVSFLFNHQMSILTSIMEKTYFIDRPIDNQLLKGG